MSVSWTPSMEARLVELWYAGTSPGEIADTITREFCQVTASAVSGKAHRIGLPNRIHLQAHGALPLPPERVKVIGRRSKAAFRTCLMCGRTFWSSHAGHRRCLSCEREVTGNDIEEYSLRL